MAKKKTQEIAKTSKELDIFWDRYNGMSNQQLASKYDIKYFTIAHSFAKGGKWVDKYNKYADDLNKESVAMAKRILKAGVEPASRTILAHLKSDDGHIALKAAKEVLDREFGKPKETHEHQGGLALKLSPVLIAQQVAELNNKEQSDDTGDEFTYDEEVRGDDADGNSAEPIEGNA